MGPEPSFIGQRGGYDMCRGVKQSRCTLGGKLWSVELRLLSTVKGVLA